MNYSELERYRLMLEGSKDEIWEWDINKNLYSIVFNKQKNFSVIDDKSIEAWKVLLHEKDRKHFDENLDIFLKCGEGIYENTYRVLDKDGGYRWIYSRGIGLKDKSGKIVRMAGSHTDITQELELNEKLYRRAYYDQLTNLPNGEKNKIDFIKLKRIGLGKATFIYIDIDYFSYINNTRGYDIGDKLLREQADFLNQIIVGDYILSRINADEFLIILKDLGEEKSLEKELSRILNSIREKVFLDKYGLHLTCSMGVSIYPDHGDNYNELVKKANIALHSAEKSGRDQYKIYTDRMDDQMYNTFDIVQQIRKGIENEEFYLVYQPIVNAKNGRRKGLEALVRWNHPFKKNISPAEFIPIAEESSQINPLEKYILESVFKDCERWKKHEKMPDFVSINLSAKGVLDNGIIDFLKKILEKYRVLPWEIELEITETAMMDSMDKTLEVLKKLKNLGFKLALDDFGTGYSSLNHLNSFPFDTVKLDKSFIDKLSGERRDKLIVESIIKLCHNMELDVVAEGVETKEQEEILKHMNCDYIQGYLYGKPSIEI